MNDEWVAPKYLTATHFTVKWWNHRGYAYVIYILIRIFLKTLSHSTVESCGDRQVFIHRFLFGKHWAGRDNFPSFNARRLTCYLYQCLPTEGISCWAAAFVLYFWSLIVWLFFFSAYVKLFRPLGTFLSTYVPSLSNFYFGHFNSLIQVSIYQFTICKALNTT